MAPTVDIVIPTTGRPSLARLLRALASALAAEGAGDSPVQTRSGRAGAARADRSSEALVLGRVLLVDDRPTAAKALALDGVPARLRRSVVQLRGGGRGPAAARNVGWHASAADWIAFLDDDVLPATGWAACLAADVGDAPPHVAGSQGRIRVPLPVGRRASDWERQVAGLEQARWATADLAYRRDALERVGGFDERLNRAYREDADVGLRIVAAGWAIERGTRTVVHPVGPADRWISVRRQAGNADDVLMDRLHGPDWRDRAAAPPGRARRHAVVTGAGVLGAGAAVGALLLERAAAAPTALTAGRRRARDAMRLRRLAAAAGAVWLAGTAELAWARIAPGPRTVDETGTMALTSVAIPFAATAHRLRGHRRWRGVRPKAPAHGIACESRVPQTRNPQAIPAAVLFDRDGTLVVDVPYNRDPARVLPMPGAVDAVASLRAAGVLTAVVSNQSGIARGLLTAREVDAVNARVEELLGPLGPWVVCPHGPEDGCDCRKPAPGLIVAAAERLGVAPERCVVVGDIGADVEAARAAGARGVLVPTARTRREEVDAADEVAPGILTAVRQLLGAAP